MKRVFFDTEFTQFRGPLLLSIGLVEESTGAHCYVELLDGARTRAASEFVRDTVIPMLGQTPGAMVGTLEALGLRVADYLESFRDTIELCYDYKTDWVLLEEALRSSGRWTKLAAKLQSSNVADLVASQECLEAEAAHFELASTPRHHALTDAQALLAKWRVRPALDTSTFGQVRAFLGYGGADLRGRTLSDVLFSKDDWWESTHDFIQSVFPLPERSGYLPSLPVMTLEEFARLAGDERAVQGVLRAAGRMLSFLSLRLDEDGALVRDHKWGQRAPAWAQRPGHNDLRITRMLRCLALLGRVDEAQAIRSGLELLVRSCRDPEAIGSTLRYWRRAADGEVPDPGG